jgi:HAD superfamily hydrolase (TIGR01509 family)
MILRGVLLDIDGTLLDSNDAHAAAWVDALREHGVATESARVRRLIGMGADNLLPSFDIDKSSARGRSLSERHRALFKRDWLPKLRPFPGARALVKRMKDAGLARIVATSADGDEVNALLRAAHIDDLIEKATTSSDAPSSKPEPDIVLAAVKRAKLDARELVMIGDTPYDVAAARGASVRIIAMRSGGWGDADLAGAIRVYEGPADLLARWDASPLAVVASH